jgi:uncharacterized protein (DUF4415 family)
MTTTGKKRRKAKIEYGTVEIPEEAFLPRNVKVRVTMMVDGDIVQAFREAAAKRGIGYQTLMNEKLRESLDGLDKTLVDRVAALERVVLKKAVS